MNLVKFLIYGAIISISFGQLAHFPFGSPIGITLTDILLILSLIFLSIWIVETKFKLNYPKIFIWIIAFWIISGISLLISLTNFPLIEVIKGSLYLFRFILYSLVFLITYNLTKSKILSKESLINFLIISGIILAGLGFAQLIVLPNFNSPDLFLTDFGFDPHQGRLASTFLDPNFMGAYLILTLGLTIYKLITNTNIKKWGLISLFLFIAIVLTYSRSAYLMLGVFTVIMFLSMGKYIFQKYHWKVLLLPCVIILLSFLIFPRFTERIKGGVNLDASAAARLSSYQNGLELFKESPLIGIGFNNLRLGFQKYNLIKTYSLDGGHSGAGVDSGFLFILSTTGILGLGIYLLFWGKVIKALLKKKTTVNLILMGLFLGLIINGQFINSLFYSPIMLWYFSLFGVSLED